MTAILTSQPKKTKVSIATAGEALEQIEHARREGTVGAGEPFVVAVAQLIEMIFDDAGEGVARAAGMIRR